MTRRAAPGWMVALLVLQAGCATYRVVDPVSMAPGGPERVAATPGSASLGVSSVARVQNRVIDRGSREILRRRDVFSRALRSSGALSDVLPLGTDTDVRLEVRVTVDNDGGNNGSLFAAAFTLYLFPVVIKESWTVETTIFDRDGARRGTIRRTGGLRTMVSLWSWLLAPLMTRGRALDGLLTTVTESTALAAAQAGLLDPGGAPGVPAAPASPN